MNDKTIGIVGGIGSYAGIDLIRKIYDQTNAKNDQDHLPISLLSVPHKVVDRTQFLLGDIDTNPGYAIAEIITNLVSNGAQVIGVPCNTAHAKPIFDMIKQNIPSSCKLINLIEEVGLYLRNNHPHVTRVGILGTTGTLMTNIYPETFKQFDIEVIQPSDEIQNLFVQPSIYDKTYGIKAISNPVSAKAQNNLLTAARYLTKRKAQAIILGCTEIPLAITQEFIETSLVIDATSILASALIREYRHK